MSAHKHYVPVLKGKRAEFPALEYLRTRAQLTPLIEMVPAQDHDFVPQRMATAWKSDRPYLIDAVFVDDEEAVTGDGTAHPLYRCFTAVQSGGQHAIPVTGTGRSPDYQSAVARITAQQRRGLGIRLVPEDFEDEDTLASSLVAISNFTGTKRQHIDLLVDVGSLPPASSAAIHARTCQALLDTIPNIADWRTLTLIAGAYPQSLGPMTRGVWNTAERREWLGWQTLIGRRRSRLPRFGDYTIASPDLPATGRATILAQLRYTTPTLYMTFKGEDVHARGGGGFGQFRAICESMISQPEYRGPGFSHGDGEIAARAATDGSTGNAETWRMIGVNHHLETVIDQIANLP